MNCISFGPILGKDLEESWILGHINQNVHNSIVCQSKKKTEKQEAILANNKTDIHPFIYLCDRILYKNEKFEKVL